MAEIPEEALTDAKTAYSDYMGRGPRQRPSEAFKCAITAAYLVGVQAGREAAFTEGVKRGRVIAGDEVSVDIDLLREYGPRAREDAARIARGDNQEAAE